MSHRELMARPRLWPWAVVLSILGGLVYGLFSAVMHVRESAARVR